MMWEGRESRDMVDESGCGGRRARVVVWSLHPSITHQSRCQYIQAWWSPMLWQQQTGMAPETPGTERDKCRAGNGDFESRKRDEMRTAPSPTPGKVPSWSKERQYRRHCPRGPHYGRQLERHDAPNRPPRWSR